MNTELRRGGTVAGYETDMGVLRVQALNQGGEALLDRVDAKLGVAIRHLERLRAGELELVPMVADEIEGCIEETRNFLGVGPDRGLP